MGIENRKDILLAAGVVAALSPVNQDLSAADEGTKTKRAQQEVQQKTLQSSYVDSEWGPTKEFSLDKSDPQAVAAEKAKIETIQDEETRRLMEAAIDDPISNDETATRRKAFERILALYGEQRLKEFLDLLVSTDTERALHEAQEKEEKEGRDEKIKLVGGRIRQTLAGGRSFEEGLYQAEEIVRHGDFDKITKIVEALREQGYKKTIPLAMMTSRWADIMEDKEEQEAFVKFDGLSKLAGSNLQKKFTETGLIPSDKHWSDLKPTDRLRVLEKFLYEQNRAVTKE